MSETTSHTPATVKAIFPKDAVRAKQGIPYFYGISGQSVAASGLAMHLVEIPPGGKTTPHFHRGFETAIYVISGRVETRFGPGLHESVINEAGSFLFIPPGVPHQPVNLSNTETARAIIARNDASEQEDVVLYDPAQEDKR